MKTKIALTAATALIGGSMLLPGLSLACGMSGCGGNGGYPMPCQNGGCNGGQPTPCQFGNCGGGCSGCGH